MPIDENNVPAAQCDADSDMPPFSASDFDPRTGWTTLDCIAADAKAAGKAVRYDPDGGGFVQCESAEDEEVEA